MACTDGNRLTFDMQEQKNDTTVDHGDDDSILKPTTNEGGMLDAAANYDESTYESIGNTNVLNDDTKVTRTAITEGVMINTAANYDNSTYEGTLGKKYISPYFF